jgi:hypothetical protein
MTILTWFLRIMIISFFIAWTVHLYLVPDVFLKLLRYCVLGWTLYKGIRFALCITLVSHKTKEV